MIMAILDVQRRARELGRIRMGRKGTRGNPEKLDRFRITSASREIIDKIATLYGGETKPWDNGGAAQWEVIVQAARIPILVPPQPITQWLETWTGGGCVHRCDGKRDVITDTECSDDDVSHANAKPTTRLNVLLREVEGLGVFRLESHGWNAAAELPMAAMFLSAVGGYVQAHLAIEERTARRIVNGRAQTARFMVPVIDIDVTPEQILSGSAEVRQISHATPERAQIEAPPTDWRQVIADTTEIEQVRDLYRTIKADLGTIPDDLMELLTERAKALDTTPQHPDVTEEPDEIDADAVWAECMRLAGQQDPPLTTDEVTDLYASLNGGEHPETATGPQLVAFRDHLRNLERAA